jgi:hypothetical protein
MSRLEEIVGIYEETDKITERVIAENKDNVELHKALALVNISQSLKNIDITLAILLDEKGGANESS